MVFLFFWLQAHACRVCNKFVTAFKKNKVETSYSVSHSLASFTLSFCGKQAWYCATVPMVICSDVSFALRRAERVGSMYNDPKERHLGKNNDKNGLWMLRGLCYNDWCCLREGFRQIFWKGPQHRQKSKVKRKTVLCSSWFHLSMWHKDDSAVWKQEGNELGLKCFTGKDSLRRLYLRFFRKTRD